MKYDPKKKMLTIEIDKADRAYLLIMYALKKMRIANNITLDRYEHEGPLTSHDFAAIAIVELSESIGIDLGVTPHNHCKLDLREA